MEPKVWGPPAWEFLHAVTFQYPEKPNNHERKKYYTFFDSLKFILPCPNCRNHYANNFESIPIRLDSRRDLIEWLIDIHNEVNVLNNKKVWTYEEVYEKYNQMYDDYKEEEFYNRLPEPAPLLNSTNMIFIVLLLVIGGCILYYRQMKGKKPFSM